MFNVSLKVDRNILVDFQSVCENFYMEYYDHLYNAKDPRWYITWSNFEAFRLKLATTIIKKSTTPADKKFSFSININLYKEFVEFMGWAVDHKNAKFSPYLEAVFREHYEKVLKELTSRAHQLQHSNN